MRETVPWPEGEPQAGLEIEENHGAVLKLLANDALGLETEPIAIEAQRAVEVIDAQREKQ